MTNPADEVSKVVKDWASHDRRANNIQKAVAKAAGYGFRAEVTWLAREKAYVVQLSYSSLARGRKGPWVIEVRDSDLAAFGKNLDQRAKGIMKQLRKEFPEIPGEQSITGGHEGWYEAGRTGTTTSTLLNLKFETGSQAFKAAAEQAQRTMQLMQGHLIERDQMLSDLTGAPPTKREEEEALESIKRTLAERQNPER